MRHILVFGLLMTVVCIAAASYGGQKSKLQNETNLLAGTIGSKIVYRAGTTVTVTAPDACVLHIAYEPLNASFDVPLQNAIVVENDMDDSIAVKSSRMTRRIRDRAPEAFEHLTLRFSRPDLKAIMKSFRDAISACNQSLPAVVAAN